MSLMEHDLNMLVGLNWRIVNREIGQKQLYNFDSSFVFTQVIGRVKQPPPPRPEFGSDLYYTGQFNVVLWDESDMLIPDCTFNIWITYSIDISLEFSIPYHSSNFDMITHFTCSAMPVPQLTRNFSRHKLNPNQLPGFECFDRLIGGANVHQIYKVHEHCMARRSALATASR